ncbi:MAG: TetR/AcrR family transcriptional regulator [Bacteroidota bacterium]
MPASYHHGDLRRALLDEAGSVLESAGIGALSLRDLARRVGVSATAPYHHFKNKADLATALADDAMADLDTALADAARRAQSSGGHPGDRLTAIGVAYVLFAVDHPERFRLAFRPEMSAPFEGLALGDGLPEDLVGFRQLVAVVQDLVPDPKRQRVAAVGAWSIAHGLAALLVDGPLRPLATDRDAVRALAMSVLAAPDLPSMPE